MRELRLRMLCSAVLAAVLMIPISGAAFAQQTAQPNVNLDLKDTDVKSAIEALFRGTGKNYSIDSNVTGTISALSIKDVPFETALKSLTKSAGLVYRQDGGVYLVSVRPDTSNLVAASSPIPEAPYIDATTDEPEIKIEKIPLNNVSATEILSILNNSDTNRGYGGYGMGGWGSNYNMGGRYSGYGNNSGYGMNSGYGYNSGYNNRYSGYGSNYGGYNNRSYGNYGNNYGSNYGGYNNRSYGGYTGSYGGYRGW